VQKVSPDHRTKEDRDPMNTSRGFRRLLIVVGTCWYVLGGVFVYGEWQKHFTDVANLGKCFREVRAQGLPSSGLTEAGCYGTWGAGNSDNAWAATIALFLPVLIYGIGKTAKWIFRGFQDSN
jgi:hypothetical protein